MQTADGTLWDKDTTSTNDTKLDAFFAAMTFSTSAGAYFETDQGATIVYGTSGVVLDVDNMYTEGAYNIRRCKIRSTWAQ